MLLFTQWPRGRLFSVTADKSILRRRSNTALLRAADRLARRRAWRLPSTRGSPSSPALSPRTSSITPTEGGPLRQRCGGPSVPARGVRRGADLKPEVRPPRGARRFEEHARLGGRQRRAPRVARGRDQRLATRARASLADVLKTMDAA